MNILNWLVFILGITGITFIVFLISAYIEIIGYKIMAEEYKQGTKWILTIEEKKEYFKIRKKSKFNALIFVTKIVFQRVFFVIIGLIVLSIIFLIMLHF